ncbi:MLP-like protein 31 [Eucalyptus grandis]|uniref:Bet v I/Major latex protein domain-containing protein n=1 Tax=Eucalyptus globulus TaxID=34317 RepID=A0ABD3LIJ3_EUCGL|nr:MLP-like protein 31 [Eucalyptus grandis]
MSLEGKLEVEIDIQSSADKFYNLFKSQIYHLPTISSDIIQKVELHDGDWNSSDAIKHWNYTLDGKSLTVKEKVEVDDANKSITFNIMEGDILKEFKSFKATGQAAAKADGNGSTVKWTLDYEKLNESVAEPKSYTDAVVKITKDVDAHLLNA